MYVKQCRTCQQRNKQAVKYTSLHLNVPKAPMQFISMDFTDKNSPKNICRKHLCTPSPYVSLLAIHSVSQSSLNQLLSN